MNQQVLTVQDVITALSKIEDKSRPISIGVQDGYWQGQYESLSDNITINDNWSHDVVIHVENSTFSFLKKDDAKMIYNMKDNVSKLVEGVKTVTELGNNINNLLRHIY